MAGPSRNNECMIAPCSPMTTPPQAHRPFMPNPPIQPRCDTPVNSIIKTKLTTIPEPQPKPLMNRINT